MSNFKTKFFRFNISLGGVTLTQKAILAKHLSVMLKSGLVISEVFEVLVNEASGKLRKILNEILLAVESGQSLADAMARHSKVFPQMFINVVRAGESAGTLEENLENIAETLEKERDLRAKIKGAMLYPAVILVAAFILGLAMAFLVLPKIVPLFEGLKVDLPFSTRALIWFSHLIRDYTSLLLIIIAAIAAAFIWFSKSKLTRPITHLILLHLPIIGKLIKEANLARFCYALATMLKSGINIDKAIEITTTTMSNYYYQQALIPVIPAVQKGKALSAQLEENSKLFPPLTTKMIKVGEKSGKLEENLFFLANFYDKEVNNSTKSLTTAIEPLLLVIIGLVVAFLALSIITPIYKITGSIRK